MNKLEEQFQEIERRVQSLVAERRILTLRVRELEEELVQARQAGQELQSFQGRKVQIRQRLEHLLQTLESLSNSDSIEHVAEVEKL